MELVYHKIRFRRPYYEVGFITKPRPAQWIRKIIAKLISDARYNHIIDIEAEKFPNGCKFVLRTEYGADFFVYKATTYKDVISALDILKSLPKEVRSQLRGLDIYVPTDKTLTDVAIDLKLTTL